MKAISGIISVTISIPLRAQSLPYLLSILSGDTLGSCVYVPCEVMKLRMQVQGTSSSWSSVILKDNISMKPSTQIYDYYTGMFHAGSSIWKAQGFMGLYTG